MYLPTVCYKIDDGCLWTIERLQRSDNEVYIIYYSCHCVHERKTTRWSWRNLMKNAKYWMIDWKKEMVDSPSGTRINHKISRKLNEVYHLCQVGFGVSLRFEKNNLNKWKRYLRINRVVIFLLFFLFPCYGPIACNMLRIVYSPIMHLDGSNNHEQLQWL